MSVSLKVVVGIDIPNTMELRRMVNGCEVVVMMDHQARHNFISWSTIEKLGLRLEGNEDFGVTLGNG